MRLKLCGEIKNPHSFKNAILRLSSWKRTHWRTAPTSCFKPTSMGDWRFKALSRMRLPARNSLCLSATKVAFKNLLLHLALDTGIKIPRNKKSTNYFSQNPSMILRSIGLLGIPKFVPMKALAHMRTALAPILPQRKKIEKFVLTLSGKKS